MSSVPESEVTLSFSRSSGAGGQNVNKVNSKVTLHWRILGTVALSLAAQDRFKRLFAHTINADGEVVIIGQESRSQKDNVDACFAKLTEMIRQAKIVPKIRKKTKPTRGAIERRLDGKKKDSDKKRQRRSKDW